MTDLSNNLTHFFINTLSCLDELLYNNDSFNKDANIIEIKRHIKKFLLVNCNHIIIEDALDLDYERTLYIKYCKNCMLNL